MGRGPEEATMIPPMTDYRVGPRYAVVVECAEGTRLVSSTAGAYYERVWYPATWAICDTPEDAERDYWEVVAWGRPNPQVRRVWIEAYPPPRDIIPSPVSPTIGRV
jgi:hypothetical protein